MSEISNSRVAESRVAPSHVTPRCSQGPRSTRVCALLRSVLLVALAWDQFANVAVFEMAKEENEHPHTGAERASCAA